MFDTLTELNRSTVAAHSVDLNKANLTRYNQRFKRVAINPDTGNYLHMSGWGETSERDYAWVGFKYQWENLQKEMVPLADFELEPALERKHA